MNDPPPAKGFFTDATLCIGCKACEVACKQWNQLPDDGASFTGMSYDNTGALGSTTWRHVAFVERSIPPEERGAEPGAPTLTWSMVSDVCKHCERAGCLEACPTGAIVRTEFGSVYVQPDICNGCGYCVSACPFGVVARREDDGRAFKCTLCYDRLKFELEPACAKACPTDSIRFGDVVDLVAMARQRLARLHSEGRTEARLYGESAESQPGTEGLHALFLITRPPEEYNLPADPVVPTKTVRAAWVSLARAALGLAVLAVGSAVLARLGERR
jgi:formate dehydrogenase iron-sulfur subunit